MSRPTRPIAGREQSGAPGGTIAAATMNLLDFVSTLASGLDAIDIDLNQNEEELDKLDNLDNIDLDMNKISQLLKHMDSTNNALTVLETRTDALMVKLDEILAMDVEEEEEESSAATASAAVAAENHGLDKDSKDNKSGKIKKDDKLDDKKVDEDGQKPDGKVTVLADSEKKDKSSQETL
ncbi:hypothetical protein HK102_003152 [Quaeritorhiza haematococci]|nr:hypothetical protein HK102_003152 [Quaeritorhiza haematococci]